MLKEEITYENALKALEKFENKKIDILKTMENSYFYGESLITLNEHDEDDGEGFAEKENFDEFVLNRIKEENGIYIRLFEIYFEELESFKDDSIPDDAFIFDEKYFEENKTYMNLEMILKWHC